jgi:hypothetical protein
MVGFIVLPPFNEYEFRNRETGDRYIIRFGTSRTDERLTRKVLERWRDNPEIAFSSLDYQYACRTMVSCKRKGPEKAVR